MSNFGKSYRGIKCVDVKKNDRKNTRISLERTRRKELKEMVEKIKGIHPLARDIEKLDVNSILRLTSNLIECYNRFKDTSVETLRSELIVELSDILDDEKVQIIVCRGDLVILYCNAAAFQEFGYTICDVLGKNMLNFIYDQDKIAISKEILRISDYLVHNASEKRYYFSLKFRINSRKIFTNGENEGPCSVLYSGYFDINREKLALQKFWEIKRANNGHMLYNVKSEEVSNLLINYSDSITIRGSLRKINDTNLDSQMNYRFSDMNEYNLLMKLDGTIVAADHRITNCIGYQPIEVKFKSAYEFIFEGDHQISIFAHKQMLNSPDRIGEIVHRLKVHGKLIHCRVVGQILHNESNEKEDPTKQLLLITSTPLRNEEGEQRRRNFEVAFTPYIKASITYNSNQSESESNTLTVSSASIQACTYSTLAKNDSNVNDHTNIQFCNSKVADAEQSLNIDEILADINECFF